jgi:Zn-finger nucleic acid-binding protein
MCTCSAAGVELDICRICQLVWFDPGEAEDFGAAMEHPLSDEARASVALAQVEVVAEAASIQKEIAKVRAFLFGLTKFRDPRK